MTSPLIWPTTPLQRGLLAAPDAYVGRARIDVRGPLDADRFAAAVASLHAAYPQLNAGFLVDADVEPTQFVAPVAPRVRVTTVDAEGLDERAAAVAAAEAEEPFDMADPPLLRWHLVTAGSRGRILLTAHHTVLDAWSLPLLTRELARLASETVAPAPEVCAYADHLDLLRSADRPAAAQHWRAALGHLAETTVPRWLAATVDDEPRGPVGARRTASAALSAAVTADLHERARETGMTLAAIVRGSVALGLDWLSGAPGTPFVTPVHGRDARLPGVENTPGLFTDSVLVAHPPLPGALGTVLADLDARWNEGLAHHHVGLGGILTALALRDPARVLYAHEVETSPARASVVDADGRETELVLDGVDDATHYPVEITSVVAPVEAGAVALTVHIAVDDRVAERDAERLAHAIRVLLGAVAADPATSLTSLDLRTAHDRRRHDEKLGGTPDDEVRTLLPEAFARACAARPDARALVADDVAYTFAELDAAVQERSRALREAIGPRHGRPLTVIHLPRTAGAVITLLGSLAAGFTTLVLDPAAPPARRDQVLADLRPDVLVDADGIRALAAPTAPAAATADSLPVGPDDTAFLVLTSGSTGTPKPVAVPHRAMAALLAHHRAHLWDERVEVLAHTTSLHVDAHWDALLGLFDGRTVRLVDTHTLLDPHALATLLKGERIDYLDIGPAVWSSHLAAGLIRRLPAVCVAGGEAFPPELWARMRALIAPSADTAAPRVLNLYGPTENAVDALRAEVADSLEPRVGVPVGGTVAHVLDEWLRPVASGTEGELYLGGTQLAHGYARRPALTAERFVAAPGGARLYRTGDRAWIDDDGSIALLGRSDDQISLNGFRIEPGEVSRALTALPHIAQAHVAGIAHPRGGKRLVAWIVTTPAGAGDADEVRARLAATLPPHLVPSAVLPVPALPVTSAGKVDLRALPRPAWAETADTADAPSDAAPSVRALVEAVAHVLGAADAASSFLALGGDSIAAIRASAALRRMGWTMAPASLLTADSLAAAAALSTPTEADAPATALPTADADLPGDLRTSLGPDVRVERILPLGGPLTGIYVSSLREAGDDPYRTATLLRLDGLAPSTAEPSVLAAAWEALATAHPVLRTVFASNDGDLPSAYVLDRAVAVHHVIDLTPEDDLEAERSRALARALAEQDLSVGRLVVAVWLRLPAGADGGARVELALGLHHLLADGWSTPLLADELARALSGAALSPEDGWSAYLAWLAAQDRHAWEELWRARYAEPEVQSVLFRPADTGSARERSGRVRAAWHPDTADETARTHAARALGVTHATAVQAAWARTLAEETGRHEVVFGLTAAGRDVPVAGIEVALGAFLTTRPVRVVADAPDGELLLSLTREVAETESAAHLGAADIARAIGPRYDSLLVIEGAPRPPESTSAGVRAVPLRGEDASGFVLTLTLFHDEDGPVYEVELDHPDASADRASSLLASFRRHLEALVGGGSSPARTVVSADAPVERMPRAERSAVSGVRAPEATVATVRRVMADVLGRDELPAADADFFALGGDSILVLHLVGALRRAGLVARVGDVFAERTAVGLAARVEPVPADGASSASPSEGSLPLTPALRWYAQHVGDARDPFVQVRAVRLPEALSSDVLRTALYALVARHEALRLRLRGDRADLVAPDALAPDDLLVEPAVPATGADAIAVARDAARSLDPAAGRLLVAVRTEPDRLVLIAHHLGVDAMSWPVLLADLRTLAAGQECPPAVSFRAAAHALAEAAHDLGARAAGLAALRSRTPASDAPARPALTAVGAARRRTLRLDAETSARLLALTGADLPVETVLAAAVAHPGQAPLTVEFEGHGRPLDDRGDARDHVDVATAVGWFTATWSVTLPGGRSSSGDAHAHLAACAAVASSVRPFADVLALTGVDAGPRPELLVNYLGREGAPGRLGDWEVAEDSGALEDALGLGATLPASHPWELNAGLDGTELVLHWQCADPAIDDDAFDARIDAVAAALRELSEAPAPIAQVVTAPPILDLVGLPAPRLAALRAAGVDGVWPMSPAQTGIALESLADTHGHYLSRTDLVVTGPLDVAALARATSRLAARHPAVRMRLAREGRDHVLVSRADAAPVLRSFATRDDLEAWVSAPLDVAADPLLRWAVAPEAGDPLRHRVVLADHHLVLDGWSVPRVVQGLFAAYRDELVGAAPERIRPAHDSDLAAHVLAGLADAPSEAEAFAAWDTVLPAAAGELFGSRSGPHERTAAALSGDVTTAAARHGLTRAEVVTFAWTTTLAALAGERAALTGQVVSGRAEASVDTIGMLLRTVPVAVDLEWGDIAAACAALTATTRLAQTSTGAPLTALARARGRTVLFDTLIVVENYPAATDEVPAPPGLRIEAIEGDDDTHYPLALTVELDDADAGALHLDRVSGLLDDRTGDRVLDAVNAVVDALARLAPTASALEVLDAARERVGARADDLSGEVSPSPAGDADPRALTTVLEAMTEALGRTPRPDEDFFALGGDSLGAMTLVTAVRERGWELTPAQVFAHPTAAGMAAALRPRGASAAPAADAARTGPAPIALDGAGRDALATLLAGIGER